MARARRFSPSASRRVKAQTKLPHLRRYAPFWAVEEATSITARKRIKAKALRILSHYCCHPSLGKQRSSLERTPRCDKGHILFGTAGVEQASYSGGYPWPTGQAGR